MLRLAASPALARLRSLNLYLCRLTTQAVDVYRSPNGTSWTFEATLSTPSGFQADMTSGGQAGAAVTGTAGRDLVAFVSANGASWQQAQAFGTAVPNCLHTVFCPEDSCSPAQTKVVLCCSSSLKKYEKSTRYCLEKRQFAAISFRSPVKSENFSMFLVTIRSYIITGF